MKHFRWLFIALLIALPVGLGGVLWERISWRPRTLLQARAPVDNVVFSHDGSLLVASVREKNEQSRLYVWDAHSLVLRFNPVVNFRRLKTDEFSIRQLYLSPDNTLLAVRTSDNFYGRSSNVLLWDLQSGQLLHTWPHLETLVFSSDSRFVTGVRESFGASWGNSQPDVVVYQARSGKIVRVFDLHPPTKRYFYGYDSSASGSGSGVSYNLSPDGRWVAVYLKRASKRPDHFITQLGGYLLVDTTGRQRTRLLTEIEELRLFSNDGTQMVTSSPPNNYGPTVPLLSLRIRNSQTGQTVHQWKLRGQESPGQFSPDKSLLLTSDEEGVQRLREASSGRLHAKLQGESTTFDLSFSPDGAWIGCTGLDDYDTRALLWDTKTGQLVRRLKAHSRPLNDMAFSPDSRTLATASNDGSLKLWRLR